MGFSISTTDRAQLSHNVPMRHCPRGVWLADVHIDDPWFRLSFTLIHAFTGVRGGSERGRSAGRKNILHI